MNNTKSTFSIKDLENLTGIKSHTIRIWEKRYNLLQPDRTDTNIRQYSLSNLQKLLNISYLNNNGYKISKIANLDEKEIPLLIKKIAYNDDLDNDALNKFKLSMINFDQALFHNTFNALIKSYSFSHIFYNVLIPLLDHIGLLWQTDTITPAQEHFIVELIKKKILVSTENAMATVKQDANCPTYILFLPDNEIHELGLLFTNYILAANGCHSIYLGQSVPMDSLKDISNSYIDAVYISSFTVKPLKDEINEYLNKFQSEILINKGNKLLISGRMTEFINQKETKKIISFSSTKALVESLNISLEV
ncbi:MerR family transcriptional regulator [Lacinutrix salivirga]